jgi:hypothetical protein
VESRGLLLTLEARARGFLIMEHSHRVIHQLKNDLNLIEMKRVPSNNPIKIQGGPSDLEPIQIEEITGLDNLEV